MEMTRMLTAKNIVKTYGTRQNKTEVLKGIDLKIEAGEFVSIMGASGSGKTTLLNVLSSIDQPSSGEIIIDNQNIEQLSNRQLSEFRKNDLGFIFQEYNLLDTLTVKENILLPMSIRDVSKGETNTLVDTLVSELGIEESVDKYPYQISGGQKQRTSAARAFIHEPKMIFADEPTGALDSKSATDLLQKLRDLQQKNQATIMMVTHDPTAASYSDRIIFLKDGQVYSTLVRGEKMQDTYYREILDTQRVLGGVRHDV